MRRVGLALAGVAVVFLVAAWIDLDGRMTRVFFTKVGEQPWPYGDHWFWKLADRYGEWPGVLMGLASGLILLTRGKHLSAERRRTCWILFLLVLVGVGVVVHGLRRTWGRARPRNVLHWSDPVPYREWWQPGGPGTGRSFPSGHVAVSVVLVAGAWKVFRERGRLAQVALRAAAIAFALMITVSRILDGAHFATDTMWSWTLVLGCWWILERAVPRGPPEPVTARSAPGEA